MTATSIRIHILLPLVAMAAVLATVLPVGVASAAAARTSAELLAESTLLELHDQARRDPGAFGYPGASVPATSGWTDIREVARAWADHMADRRELSHNPAYADQLCCWWSAGENVGVGSLASEAATDVDATARRIFTALMASASHRANILDPDFDELGIGVAIRDGRLYVAVNFRERAEGTPPGDPYHPAPSREAERPPAHVPGAEHACPADAFPRDRFADTAASVHGDAVDCLVWWQALTLSDGVDEGRFAPATAATRGLLAATLDRLATAAGRPFPAGAGAFTDTPGHRYGDAIERMAAAGLATGYGDGRFGPDDPIERGQLASLIARTYRDWLHYEVPATVPDHFVDDDGIVHEVNIDLLAELGIAAGLDGERFGPVAYLDRGQLATFTARLAEHVTAHGQGPAA